MKRLVVPRRRPEIIRRVNGHALLPRGSEVCRHLGADGAVSYLFYTVALLTYPPGTDEERLRQVAVEAGATFLLDRAQLVVEADRAAIFVIGVAQP